MLPQHDELLQSVQQRSLSSIVPDRACCIYGAVRTQLDKVLTQAKPQVVWLAPVTQGLRAGFLMLVVR
ncbi:hypothetical protein [Acidovorax radicis]|uniref:hypothetical protein n=1 Tax=Acidovorax radicis TaxID=758826 RepID=UPI001CF90757|nr:hypothetical protein [Acidovorax radicis]UCU98234.1 hypothetical protein KI609_17160 [Acidovorax radicis]